MEVQQDFRELLELLNSHRVEYIIVGGFALAFHGFPRFTGDLDVFLKPDDSNARLVIGVLKEFGFGFLGLTSGDFENPDQIIQLGMPPVRIDLITSITGVSWDEAWAGRVEGLFGDIPVSYLGRRQFIKNKKATGRLRDLADLEAMGEK